MIRIVQWNSHHGGKRHKDTDPKETLDTAGFGDALAALAPDVVCLNELEIFHGYGNTDQIEILRQRLGAVAAVGVYRDGTRVTPGSSGQANAILSRWPIAHVQVLGLPGNRAAIAGVVHGVTIVSAHLDDQSVPGRAAEVTALLAWPPLQAEQIILCGDWNAAPGATELAPLVGAYEDAWLVGRAQKIATAFNTTGNTRSARIDAIFSKGLELTAVAVPDTRLHGMFPSDHHPIVATFTDPVVTEPDAPGDAITPTEASVMTACAAFAGYKQFIETWTLLAVSLEVPLEKIQAAGQIAEQLEAWCQQYGPWDPLRPRRSI